MNYDLSLIAHVCCGDLCGADFSVSEILTDSRRLCVPQRTIFVALQGPRHDGSAYIRSLYSRGVRAFLVKRGFASDAFPDASFVFVDDSLAALQAFAHHHRVNAQARVLAICGSNGKTIVKEWLSQLIADDIPSVRSPRSYNSQVGVPLSLLKIEPDDKLAIIETGISLPGEMQRLRQVVEPDDVLITNIGQAHQENFSSLDAKLKEKLSIASNAKRVFFCADQPEVSQAVRRSFPTAELVGWGADSYVDYVVSSSCNSDVTSISVRHGAESWSFQTSLADDISIENLCHAIVYALHSGVSPRHVADRISSIGSVGMRLEQMEGHNGCTIINDAYNADITSLEVALDMLHVMGDRKGLSRTLILSDLQQTGLPDDVLYRRVAQLLAEKKVDRLIGIGARISMALADANTSFACQFFASTDDFLRRMSTADFRKEAILLKGQRNFSFERIAEALVCLRNRTVMEVNLNALAHNIAYFRSFLKPGTKLLAMVKAFSYGTGSFEIAKLMQEQGVDYLGVAFADEGYDLREAGITLPIAVMNPEAHSYDLMLKYDLEPEIYSFETLKAYSDAVGNAGLPSAPIHIKFNTGMSRSGFEVFQAADVASAVVRLGNLRVVSAFSHLVESEDAAKDDATRHQIALFSQATDSLRAGLGYSFTRHILNSAGIERFPDSQMEMVRLGIGLYGVSAIDNARLRNVASLKSYVSQIRNVKAGESVGYNRRTVLSRDSRIAVVPIGYADGVDRRLSNGVGRVLINGHFAPVAGNVCMDIIMIDVTDVPSVAVGDSVELFGDSDPVWNMADRIGTICYEILTGIGRRVKRVYFLE